MDQRDVHNAFVILFPVVWALVDRGEPLRAEKIFLLYVCNNYDKFYGDDSSSSTYYFYLYKPLRFLLRLACDAKKEAKTDGHYEDIEQWIFSEDFCTIQRYLPSYMCALGKDSNCILAEICCLLASMTTEPTSSNQISAPSSRNARRATIVTSNSPGNLRNASSKERRQRILRKGLEHAKISMKDTEGIGYDYARGQIVKINRRLEALLALEMEE